jgi:C1A family cysteine protease
MQLPTKWGALVLVALLLGSLGTAGLVLAKSDSSAPAAQTSASSSLPATLHAAPLNPAYVQYQQEKAAGKVATQTVDGHGLGWMPPTIKPSTATTAASLTQAQTYPVRYDLRTYNKVSPVEDQGNCGSCWTFATFGSLESYLLPGLTTQYSENNLKNLADFSVACCGGGDAAMSTAYLARWGWNTAQLDAYNHRIYAGPETSTLDPYSLSCTSPPTSQVAMHVQNVYYVPVKQSPLDNNAIKSALTTYGGVYTAFQWNETASTTTTSTYYNPTTAAYYDNNPQDTNTGNHAVTIVGWDDNYAKTNFSTTPPGNGAWIVKNSWGTSFGKSGYFYVSYYDLNMGYQENAVFTAEPTTNYNTNYQYDALGWVDSYGSTDIGSSPSTTAWGANVFTATSNQQLSAVSFYAGSVNTQYQIYVYTDPTSGPIGGTEHIGPVGTTNMSGYYTVPLTTTVPLTAGHQFSVVIEITTPGSNYPIPVESTKYQWGALYSSATGQPGQGYLSATGTSWTDATQVDTNMSICIKAFAKTVGVAGAPAVTAQNANSLDLFFRRNDSALWWKHWDGTTWSTSTSLGGILTSDPAAASPGNSLTDVFVRGTDGAIWEKTTTNGGASWSGWNSLGGQIPAGTGPAVCSWGSGRLDLFVQGTDGALWRQWYTGTSWSGWQPLGGQLTSSAAAATAPGSSRIDVFVRGTDGAIWQRTTTNRGSSWSGWTSRGGQIPANTIPAASSWGSGRLDLFANGTDGQLWWQYTSNGGSSWTGWQPLGGKLTSSPAAAAPASGIMDVFVRGSDNGLWERTYTSGSWSGWTSIAI